MTFLINCSNLNNGGGLQVADSIIKQLGRFHFHRFIVLRSSILIKSMDEKTNIANVIFFPYDIKNGSSSFFNAIVTLFIFFISLQKQFN